MKKHYNILTAAIFSLGLLSASAQTVHEVTVSNFAFEPANITIQVGDMVRWTNTEGFHNVGTDAFPDNPDDFGNELSNEMWVYEFTFTEVGTNFYQCDQHPGPMQGSVIVEDNSLSVGNPDGSFSFTVYPNPVSDVLKWKWSGDNTPKKAELKLYDLTGQLAAEFSMKESDSYDISALRSGVYHYQVDLGEGGLRTGKLFVQKR